MTCLPETKEHRDPFLHPEEDIDSDTDTDDDE